MKRFCLFLTLLLCSIPGFSQSSFVSRDAAFVDYLIGNNLAGDALLLLESGCYHESDTLFYLKGLAAFNSGCQDKSEQYFSKVPQGSAFFDQSLFTRVVSLSSLGRYDEGLEALLAYSGPYAELRQLDIAAFSLLKGDMALYEQAARDFTYSDYALASSEKVLDDIFHTRSETKEKSPLLAALASSLVPGLGKVYAGRADEGIMSFLAIGALAAFTAENWVKCGPDNWKTILFGSLGTLLYIGNIYGSYVSVGICQTQTRNAQNTAIVYNIHIPVRSLFR